MCCSTTRSWQGDPLRVPVASPRPVAHPGLSLLAPVKRFAVSSLAGRLRSPQPPSTKGHFIAPLEPLPNPAQIGCRQRFRRWMTVSVSTAGLRPRKASLDAYLFSSWVPLAGISLVNLSLDIFQRSQRISSLGSARIALRQLVKNLPKKSLQFTESKSCKFIVRDEFCHFRFPCFLQARTPDAFLTHGHRKGRDGRGGKQEKKE